MTCIVGLKHKGKVYMGGDSAGVSNYSLQIRADEKVFKKNDFVFGFTDSFRMGQIIRYELDIPDREYSEYDKNKPKKNTNDYLHQDFLPILMDTLSKRGFASIKDNVVEGGIFLFGYQGELYYICGDFQIGRVLDDYNAIGCGFELALGALNVLDKLEFSPEDKILSALETAEKYCIGVRRPFNIINI